MFLHPLFPRWVQCLFVWPSTPCPRGSMNISPKQILQSTVCEPGTACGVDHGQIKTKLNCVRILRISDISRKSIGEERYPNKAKYILFDLNEKLNITCLHNSNKLNEKSKLLVLSADWMCFLDENRIFSNSSVTVKYALSNSSPDNLRYLRICFKYTVIKKGWKV